MNIRESVRNMKTVSPVLAASSAEVRNEALIKIAEALAAHAEEIFAANRKDLAAADEKGIAPAVKKRLLYSEGKMQDSVAGLRQLASLPDPLGKVTLDRELDEGLRLTRVTCPIGVIGVIFEARPDALVQISSLCLKSGNCAVLKGGKETAETNRVLFEVIYRAAVEAGLPEGCLLLAEQHSEIDELLTCDKEVDLLIPRGSNAFVRYIMDHTKIPVMGHADGICHIFVDKDADQDKAIRVIIDAKTQYTAACNAVETILVDRAIAGEFLPKLAAAFEAAGIKMRGTAEVSEITPCEVMGEEDFATEYLDLIASVKLVDGVAEAVRHINYFGSHHTDSVMTENEETAAYFTQMVDSTGVYVNVSTRFADGFRYGFGAEVGISTGKIHARGPVGLEGLVTYKYRLTGDGHIVGDYASGKRTFH
ncbi:MAG: glutamate-5-semialdehyde dehydrogenase, partial [Lachnospiraceae bacterium]|nr:glutamate-5-semialdehyde dehydrogenase [Lachnospiraceae bacterium]